MNTRCLALALAALALPLSAQVRPPASASEVIEVQVTNLDVIVTDAKGKRVSGLTKEDFEVLENGVTRAITNISEIGRVATTASETTQVQPRRILLLVDNGTIALSARRKIFDATRKTLDKLLIGPADQIAIATISRSITQRLAWTNDRKEALRVLNEAEMDAILPRADMIELERSLTYIVEDADFAATPAPGSGTGRARGKKAPPVDFEQVVTRGRNYAQNQTNETKQTLAAINGALAAFAGAPGGRKLLIIAGGSLPLNAGDPIFLRIESVRSQMEMNGHKGFTGTRTASPLGQNPAFDVTALVDEVAANARLKGVAIYAVNPEFGERQLASVQSQSVSDNNAEFAAMTSQLNGYNRLANGTGGAAMIGAPAEVALTQIRDDLESSYSIGYRSSGPIDAKTQITVKVKKGLRARASIASGAVDRGWEVGDQVVANHLLDHENDLGISLSFEPAVSEGTKLTIPVNVVIPVDQLKLVKKGNEYTAEFAVFISLGDENGNGTVPMRQEKTFRWPADTLPQIKGRTIGFKLNVDADETRDRISIGVLDHNSGATGFATEFIE